MSSSEEGLEHGLHLDEIAPSNKIDFALADPLVSFIDVRLVLSEASQKLSIFCMLEVLYIPLQYITALISLGLKSA